MLTTLIVLTSLLLLVQLAIMCLVANACLRLKEIEEHVNSINNEIVYAARQNPNTA